MWSAHPVKCALFGGGFTEKPAEAFSPHPLSVTAWRVFYLLAPSPISMYNYTMKHLSLATILVCLSMTIVQCNATHEGETWLEGGNAQIKHKVNPDGTIESNINVNDGGNSKKGFESGFDEHGHPFVKNSGSFELNDVVDLGFAKKMGYVFIAVGVVSAVLIWGLKFHILSTAGTIVCLVCGFINIAAMEALMEIAGNAIIPSLEVILICVAFFNGTISNWMREKNHKKEIRP